MPVIKLYHHGSTAGMPPSKPPTKPAKRGNVTGWTDKTTRSNIAFLRSVSLPDLSGFGIAFTLTLRDCPATHDDWKKLRESFFVRLRRLGMIRLHWVTEWQRRGVPHLHGVAYFPTDDYITQHGAILDAWLTVSAPHVSQPHAQHLAAITDALGWLKYLAKHAARGVSHYQRSPENVPDAWAKTGRVWGKLGDWPADEPMRFELDNEGYYRFRRLVRSWRVADARAAGSGTRLASARRMLKCNDPRLSSVRGVSEWIPESLSLAFIGSVADRGCHVNM